MHFIFDCDDVLLNWQDGFIEYIWGRGYRPNLEGPSDWNLAEWIGCTDKQARDLITYFNNSSHFGNLRPCDGAVDLLWKLKLAGHTMDVLTCCGTTHGVRYRRSMNLMEHFARPAEFEVREPYSEVQILDLGASKFEALHQYTRMPIFDNIIFVEDNFSHARSGVLNGIKSYCLRRSHNRKEEAVNPDSGVIWIDDFAPLLETYIP